MKKKILSILLAIVLVVGTLGLVACGETGAPPSSGGGDPTDKTTQIKFWYYGDLTATEAYAAMVDAYNAGQGKIDGVQVTDSVKPEDGYVTTIQTSMSTKSGPDVYFAWDRYYKEWTAAGMTTNLQPYIDADDTIDLDSIWTSTVDRFRYNKELNLSSPEEDSYGLPVDTSPTALFYNRDAMEAVGVIVISVAEEDLDAWNAGGVEDAYGNTKEELGITVDVPAKGYFRNDNNLYNGGEDREKWYKPAQTTLKVFNDKIAMNWDEAEDLGHLMTKHGGINSSAITDYGYFTEWWFNFGWSVGGDCVEDMSGYGSWTYSHGDYSANYIVNEGHTYVGAITGKTYQAGETLEFLDKLDVAVGDEIASDDLGGYLKGGSYLSSGEYDDTNATLIGGKWNGEITSNQNIRPSVVAATEGADPALSQLPSIREAFTRFTRLAGMEGRDLNICPYPSSFGSGSSSIQYFTNGKLGFIVERGFNIALVDEFVGNSFTWAVAPLPVYKEYVDATDPSCDEIKVQGRIAGHSESTALVIRAKSTKKDASYKFIKWMVGPEAQAIKASYGFIPNQIEEADHFYDALDPSRKRNLDAFINAAEYETPGDWWYMINKDWIDVWASPLNSQVRYGIMDLDDYFETYLKNGNAEVEAYGNYTNGLGAVKDYSAN